MQGTGLQSFVTHGSPIIRGIGTQTGPMSLYRALANRRNPVLLESTYLDPELGRISLIAADPFMVFKSKGDRIEITSNQGREILRGDPFKAFGSLMRQFRTRDAVPYFCGGAIGYLSYDMHRFVEDLPDHSEDDLNLPDCWFGFYDRPILVDHLTGQTLLIDARFESEHEEAGGSSDLERDIKLSEREIHTQQDCSNISIEAGSLPESNLTDSEYFEIVLKAKEYIARGDIYQVNLSRRFSVKREQDPADVYALLRKINPAPFSALLDLDECSVISCSPELFLRINGRHIQTRPIKGTRARGETALEDMRLANELLTSEKDRAENLMIVDLERNDLGRVCSFGTVSVPELFRLETYANVHHLTSTVEGLLSPRIEGIEVVRACFPGGSITGAPKKRAMEIIEELEPTKRNIYTGSIGFFSFSGNLELNIAIRTMIATKDRFLFQAGGAVTADSEPRLEHEEILAKSSSFFQALKLGELSCRS